MHVAPAKLDTVMAYLRGFDVARDGGPLCGLREWLIVRLNEGNNQVWEGLVTRLFPAVAEQVGYQPGEEASRIRALGAVLEVFFQYRREQGLTKIFHDYGKWLLKHRWYNGPVRQKQD
jgi:hypothetical protein